MRSPNKYLKRTYVLHADGWAVGYWNKEGRWQQHSKHKLRSQAVAAMNEVNSKERINALSNPSPPNHVPAVDDGTDSPL